MYCGTDILKRLVSHEKHDATGATEYKNSWQTGAKFSLGEENAKMAGWKAGEGPTGLLIYFSHRSATMEFLICWKRRSNLTMVYH